MKRRVLIATPAFGGLLTDHYVQSLLETQKRLLAEKIQFAVLILSNESLIGRGRNKCAQIAIQGNYTDLFFIDADIGWKVDDFMKILMSTQHIVGGTYPMKMMPVNLNYNLLPEDRPMWQNNHIKSVENMKKLIEYKGTEEFQVQHLPTGFLRISGTVLKRLKGRVEEYQQQNPRTGQIEIFWNLFPTPVKYKNLMSEDWAFCEICRDNKIPVFLNGSVICNHVGSYNYGESIQR